jgi:hypothetical protein
MTFKTENRNTYFGPERMSNCTSFMILHMGWGEEQGRDLVFVPPQPLTHVDPPLYFCLEYTTAEGG